MTETTVEIFKNYEVRKTKKQKDSFVNYLTGLAEGKGYSVKIESGSMKSKNVVIGDPLRAKVVYTAHYDTCPRLPFPNFITPKNVFLYILYQLLITVAMIGLPLLTAGGVSALLEHIAPDSAVAGAISLYLFELLLFAELLLMMKGPANPHTANDNTSGVTTLVDIMMNLPEDLRATTAFIFFDNEEIGLVGSSSYSATHKAEMKGKLLLNFDCVSDGRTMLFAIKKGAAVYIDDLRSAFPTTEKFTPEFLTKGVFYPSDQARFPLGVGVAALKKTKRGILYMNRIHTAKDTVYEEENIAYLTEGAIRLSRMMAKKP